MGKAPLPFRVWATRDTIVRLLDRGFFPAFPAGVRCSPPPALFSLGPGKCNFSGVNRTIQSFKVKHNAIIRRAPHILYGSLCNNIHYVCVCFLYKRPCFSPATSFAQMQFSHREPANNSRPVNCPSQESSRRRHPFLWFYAITHSNSSGVYVPSTRTNFRQQVRDCLFEWGFEQMIVKDRNIVQKMISSISLFFSWLNYL